MSTQIGQIIAGGGPALLHIMTQAEPAVRDVRQRTHQRRDRPGALARTTRPEVASFVAYIQAELPVVERFLGNVITLFSHLAQGAAPFGGVLLADINLFVHALALIPVSVLRTAIPLAISLYARSRPTARSPRSCTASTWPWPPCPRR